MAKFEQLSKSVFRRRWLSLRASLNLMVPMLSGSAHIARNILHLADGIVSFLSDGLYPSVNIEKALQQVCGMSKSILDVSHATATGTLVGLPVATADEAPSCRVFTNFNGSHELTGQQDLDTTMIGPREGVEQVPLWEMYV